jgi:multidrug efflux pump subunit AcrB
LIPLIGGYAIRNTPTDIFPNIRIPVAAVIWRYTAAIARGSSPGELA